MRLCGIYERRKFFKKIRILIILLILSPILQTSDENKAPGTGAGAWKIKMRSEKEEKKMTKSFTTIYRIITKAAEEAGIRDNENYTVDIISSDSDLLEFVLETEWTVTTCYADPESTQILGLMTEAKPLETLLEERVVIKGRTNQPLKVA